jgi:cysteine desulfuration protein SufE
MKNNNLEKLNLEKLTKKFGSLENWSEKYQEILELGQILPEFKQSLKNPQNLVNGCSSRSWLEVTFDKKNQRLSFLADSDSLMVKGLMAIILAIYNNQTTEFILKTDLSFLQKLGLSENLSPHRANGMLAVIKKIKLYASIFGNQNTKNQ